MAQESVRWVITMLISKLSHFVESRAEILLLRGAEILNLFCAVEPLGILKPVDLLLESYF